MSFQGMEAKINKKKETYMEPNDWWTKLQYFDKKIVGANDIIMNQSWPNCFCFVWPMFAFAPQNCEVDKP